MRGIALTGAIGLPLLYFGAQAAAIATLGYDWRRDIVSLLGAAGAPAAAAFNGAMVGSGVAALIAAVGLPASGARRWPLAGFALAVAMVGAGNIWAGVFPLPDPRHLANPFLPGFVALPALALVASWCGGFTTAVRGYALANLIAFAVLAWLRADQPADAGLWQRLHALTVYLPVAVLAAARPRQPGVSSALSTT